jgi:hypothetical protein
MNAVKPAGIAAVLLAVGLLASCAGGEGEPVIAPVTMDVGDLQGETVELVVGQVLNINTGDLEGSSYRGEVADTAVAEFVAGREDDSATFNPGVKALAKGTTEVVLSNTDGGIQDVTFTVEVDAD